MVRQAGLEGRIACHAVALADRDGVARMAVPDGLSSGLARMTGGDGITVRLARLDSLGLPAPTAIKIDAEDAELAVLDGARETIAAARPFILMENWLHAGDPNLTLAPLARLAEWGYGFYAPGWAVGAPECILDTPGPTPELALVPFIVAQRFQMAEQMNLLAVPAERRDDLQRRFA